MLSPFFLFSHIIKLTVTRKIPLNPISIYTASILLKFMEVVIKAVFLIRDRNNL